MRSINYLALLLFQISFGQQAFHNSGNVQIHDQGQMGFHIDLVNNGMFNQNLGLAGFYNMNNPLTISGNNIPQFQDIEVAVDENLYLEINTRVSNTLNYIIGDVITPRNNPSISLDYQSEAIFGLEDDLRLTDGYASYNGYDSFTFPIGDDNKLRPLITPLQSNNTKFKAAYYNEDPNFPSVFPIAFDTSNTETIINTVSTIEYWDFDGEEPTSVTLTWNQESEINLFATELINLRVVGWSESQNKWLDLGNTNITGDFNNGTISSTIFTPNDFTVITFGGLIGSDGLVVYNGFSPNNDTLNETFVIEGIELFQNELKIFNRWGRIVYDAKNYKNDWDGKSNKEVFLNRNGKLPVGTYYYVINLPTENKSYAGWIYINY